MIIRLVTKNGPQNTTPSKLFTPNYLMRYTKQFFKAFKSPNYGASSNLAKKANFFGKTYFLEFFSKFQNFQNFVKKNEKKVFFDFFKKIKLRHLGYSQYP